MLVGQIYRDFASKEDIVAAIVERDLEAHLADDPLRQAAMAGDANAVRAWIAQFVTGEKEEGKELNLIADIMAETRRNPRIAQIVTRIHDRLHETIAAALAVLAPDPAKDRQRLLLTEVILTISSGTFHRQLVNTAAIDPVLAAALNRAIEREIDALIGA